MEVLHFKCSFSSAAPSREPSAILHKQSGSTTPPLISLSLGKGGAARQQITPPSSRRLLCDSWADATGGCLVSNGSAGNWYSSSPPFLPSTGTYKCFVLWKHSLITEVGRINEFVGGYLRLFFFILMPFDVLLCSKLCGFHWNIWTRHASWLVRSLQHRFRGSFVTTFTTKDSDNSSHR